MRHTIIHASWIAALLSAGSAFAADPPDGAITESGLEVSYTTGPMPLANVSGLPEATYTCDEINPCDIFELTVDLPDDYLDRFPKAKITIVTAAMPEYADIDLQLADESGKLLGVTRDNPPAQPSLAFKPKSGLHKYQVQIIPGTPVPDASATITMAPGTPAKSGVLETLGGGFNLALLLPLLGLGLLRRR